MKFKSVIGSLKYLLKTYVTSLPLIVYRSSISLLLDPKGSQQFIHDVLNAIDLRDDDRILESIDVTDLVKGEYEDISIIGRFYIGRSSDTRLLSELASIAYILKTIKPASIFEFGTFVGRITRLFAHNSPANCKILTIDLEQEKVTHQIGEELTDPLEQKKITQLHGDSLSFDFTPWYDACDFIWIDACHEYRYVVQDTRNAMKLCRPGGYIAWHDYRHTAWWSGVTRCVREFNRNNVLKIYHIRGTTIAIAKML